MVIIRALTGSPRMSTSLVSGAALATWRRRRLGNIEDGFGRMANEEGSGFNVASLLDDVLTKAVDAAVVVRSLVPTETRHTSMNGISRS